MGGILLLFTGDTNTAKRPFIKKKMNRQYVELHVHVFKTPEQLHKAIAKYKPDDLQWIVGFSVWSYTDSRCDVYVLEVKEEDDFDTWGHEIAHCLYGKWHKE